ncbi:hypothetical protein ACH4LN_27105 [Streptomyces albus]|uniref:Uncharacterized protein n=1 Tax=Streptomyces albus TaxID=1888 RepID=A0A8H1LFW6_9ACTN|nr:MULTISPECIES: hypothetical protein [Streptomyces]KPC95217.1 hypothetical protein ADL27_10725 [Streptomyces sp. NRRL F-6602]EPD93412.1 hypothetical protein HMPREF1486_03929 [Streptomyces sp. HPH0547]MDI6408851.1 hypothetical protein [Streptomyces albus]TGG85500.1 hypothetical protein D8771_09990 [Streptomyces albus]UVN53984.1 hypothetical protein NR995_05170 [Streptomyces albus]
MNDFSGVDPYRLRDLANALQGLADTLDREGKTIRDLFTKWEGTLGQGVLTQQAAQVRDDARSMALRADFAYNVLLQPRIGPVNSPLPPNWVNIPWDVSRIDTAQEGAQEARSLLAALNNPDSPQSRTTLRMLSQSLADHANDPAFLQAFMNAGGLEASARAARFLHTQDGTHGEAVLSQESEQILARFGQAVQAATSLAEQGKIKLSPTYLEALTKPKGGDMWSVAMLFKYGPKGDKWDAKVLSSVGGAMLDWRSKQQMRPDYSPPSMNIGGYVPGGYVEGDNPWYESLGLNVSYLSVGSGDAAVRIRGIAANDPSLILMQRVGENADASRQLLTGPDGARHAKALVNDKWHTPGPQSFNDAQWPAAVIIAATTDRKGHPEQSAEAAANVINAGAAEYGAEKGKNEYQKTQYPVPAGITRALAQVFATYVPDFAESHGMPKDQAAAAATGKDNAGRLIVGHQTALNFLSMIMQNKDDAGNVVNAVNAQVSLTAARGMDSPEAGTYMENLAELQGEVTAAGHQVGLDAEKLKDEANKKTVLWVDSLGAAVTAIPGIPVQGEWVQTAIAGALPAIKDSFSVDNAQKYQEAADIKFYDDRSAMRLPLMRGLLLGGKIKPPEGHPEWANGQISLKTPGDLTDFNSWWQQVARQQGGQLDRFDDGMRTAFDRGNSAR